jgi:HEAT repeat protein
VTASASVAELVGRLGSPDFNARALALAELVEHGNAATAALVDMLDGPDAALRAQAARGLAEIADPASAAAMAAALEDSSPDVRGHAAHALVRMGDPRAVEALVRTLDDVPDLLHDPYTLSAYALIDLGRAALPAVAPLLMADDPATRERAFLVVRSVVEQLPGAGEWDQLRRSLGSYDPRGDNPERDRAAGEWQTWIARSAP